MIRLRMPYTYQLLAVLGLCCSCATASLAQSAGPSGLEGGMTAFQFDGLYKGDSQRVIAKQDACAPRQEVALDVRNGRFKLNWHGPQVFDAKIARDGSFYATTGSVGQAEKHMTILPTLQGRIDAAGLVADYGTRWCRYRLEASQSPVGQQHLSERTDATRH
jgi:hypothetical protein